MFAKNKDHSYRREVSMCVLKNRQYLFVVFLLCVLFFIPLRCNAVTETSRDNFKVSDAVYETTAYADDLRGNNLCLHILKLGNNAGVSFRAGCGNYYKKGSTAAQRKTIARNWTNKNWSCKTIVSQLKEFNSIKDKPGEVIAAFNADLFYMNGKTTGNLVIEGNKIHQGKDEPYFAVLKNGELDIRNPNESLDDVQEAVGGSHFLLNNGKVLVADGGEKEPRMALGMDDENNVIIIAIEGRSPFSAGATLYETAQIMKQQGCRKAINLDGGGSSSFMTKRFGEEKLKHRNRLLEKRRRNIASTLYIIRDRRIKEKANKKRCFPKVMNDSHNSFRTLIRKKKEKGFCMIGGEAFCFVNHNKGYSGTVQIGNYKYVFKKGKLIKSSDKAAGDYCVGYCGKEGKESGLVYVYHIKDKVLNIGTNPFINKGEICTEMKNWKSAVMIPWHSIKTDIRKVYIGNNIKTIGDNFLCFPRIKNYDGTPLPGASVDVLHISDSVRRIGNRSFYNLGEVEEIKSPNTFEKIGKEALDYSNLKTIIKKKQ